MKTFKEYLTEGKKQYDFRVKIAGDVSTEQENELGAANKKDLRPHAPKDYV